MKGVKQQSVVNELIDVGRVNGAIREMAKIVTACNATMAQTNNKANQQTPHAQMDD